MPTVLVTAPLLRRTRRFFLSSGGSRRQLVVLVSAFIKVSTVWSVSFLLFFYSRCPSCPAICKSGGTCPPCPMESAPLIGYDFMIECKV